MKLEELRQIIMKQISGSEYENTTWFAGGCVRDHLLYPDAELPADIDLTVEMPEGGIKLARYMEAKLGARVLKCHPEYGTAMLEYMNLNLEFVATRKERYRLNSRYPQVSFGSLKDDVMRRDFTINSLLLPISGGEMLDLSGQGIGDLKMGIIRSLGDPVLKFREDPLRMLRALRFALRFSFTLEDKTLQALLSERVLLHRLSKAQIKRELDKMRRHSEEIQIMEWFKRLEWSDNPRLMLFTNAKITEDLV